MSPFAQLLAMEGVTEESELRSRFGIMAFHGGGLEEMTDIIAREVAVRADASYYAVLQPAALRRHIPSHQIDPAVSPSLSSFLEHVEVVITLHGFGRAGLWQSLLLGGQNRELADHVATHLRSALPDYEICADLAVIPKDLRGQHRNNPVNLPAQKGVQIELPPRVRGASPIWADWVGPGHTPHTQALIEALVSAAVTWAV
jgi:phage replication-related protein YjqB (UPF0714/DUF867 family)